MEPRVTLQTPKNNPNEPKCLKMITNEPMEPRATPQTPKKDPNDPKWFKNEPKFTTCRFLSALPVPMLRQVIKEARADPKTN